MRRILLFLALALAGVALFSRLPATPAANAAPAADLVRVFIDLPDRPQANDDAVVRALGGTTRHQFATSNTISIEIPPVALTALQRYSRFFNIRPVPTIQALDDTLDWGVDRVDADRVWGGTPGATSVVPGNDAGQGVKVGIIDTGIDRGHSDLVPNTAGGQNWVLESNGSLDPSNYGDQNGHGTHVAGTIAAADNGSGMVGVAPQASLYALRVLDKNGSGYLDDAAAALEWAAGLNGGTKLDVVNMSFGCSCNYAPMQAAADAAYAAGVLLVAAAGNNGSGSDTVIYPAHYSSVIAVAAVCGPYHTNYCNTPDTRASFSSTGSKVELAAPGDYIRSDYPSNSYAYLSGTSMASPHVTGTAALVKEANPSMSPADIRARLDATATDLGSAGRDTSFGYGLVNAVAAVGGAGSSGGGGGSTPTYDVAVTAVSASPAELTVGSSTTVSVTVADLGNQAENNVGLTVTDTTSGTQVASTAVSLAAGGNTTLQFPWNTTGATTGDHTIVATLASVSGETNTGNNAGQTTVTVDPPPPVNTGFLNCSAWQAVTSNSGHNNGYESNPGSACADDSAFANDNNSGTSTSTSCSSSSKDREVYYNYNVPLPAGATIQGIEVRLDAWVDAALSSRFLCVELSGDGGAHWTSVKTTPNLGSNQGSYVLGSASDLWGGAWTPAQLSNQSFRIRITDVANSTTRDFRLDWVALRVTYTTP